MKLTGKNARNRIFILPIPVPTRRTIPLLIASFVLVIAIFVTAWILLPPPKHLWHVAIAALVVGFPILWGYIFALFYAVVRFLSWLFGRRGSR